ncbi:cell division protein MukB [Bacillus cereus group sp. TH172LC]|uniref:cell division protein MukB n=1 Tax=unclassified Bacillus cereus group TaxID=2750818 RepID=UPI0022E5259D|nr:MULTISPECIES: cell division protein MukB [unclassified Bacillus cereus group]MDA1630413.1 cell division protein MukB [Bacillus cereus group sp. TH172LC]MDA1834739.1 cell division protein MukB [Bacillus cereus group sp. BY142LC]
MNNLFMIISILGGLSSLTLTVVLITSLFVKRLKTRRKKFAIALVTSVILCVVGGALYEISPEDKARIAQEAETTKAAEAKEKADKEEKAKAQEQAKKEAEEKKAQEEARKKEAEATRKTEKEEAERIKAEEKAKKETEKAEREAQKAAEEEKKKAESDAKKKAEEEEAKRLKAEKEAKAKEEQEQKIQAKKEKEERDKKEGTKVKIEHYNTCNSQGKYCDRGGFHKGAFDTLQLGMNPEEVTLKLDRNAEEATIYYMKDKSGNYVELINYYFEGAVYNVNTYFKDGKLYYAERNDKLHKPEERLMLGELE